MYSTTDIFARLQNGETSEAIANEMASVLNDAIAQYEEQKDRIRVQKEKRKEGTELVDRFNDYLNKYYPELGDVEIKVEDLDKILKQVANVMEAVESLNKVSNRDVDKVIDDFLKTMKF